MATILCVDDDPNVGLILEDTLQRAGHATVMARHVPEALHALAAQEIDLIISDYRMPGITGLEFLTMLGREGHDVPLIMLTGYASIEHAVMAIKAGAVDYISKPFKLAELLAAAAVDAGAKVRFVNLREHAGWSREAKGATPKMAALIAMAAVPEPQPSPAVSPARPWSPPGADG